MQVYSDQRIQELEGQVDSLKNKLFEEQQAHLKCLALLESGEALREQLMIKAIIGGVFNPVPVERQN